ncbi:phage terminase small subunit P27 family [Paraburkholderia atlantica]|uniref:phage terminase small subunit P27 family n=1 Tax=Paraburkholderia atlantica TaxID=2654982 RepID=UPI003D1C5184
MKIIRGTQRSDRVNRHEPKPPRSRPTPPAHLDAVARREWQRVAGPLYKLGLLSTLDRAALGCYCTAYSRWQQAEAALADSANGGLIVRTANGTAIQNPLVGVSNRAMLLAVRFATEFGMSPASRANIRATPPETGKLWQYDGKGYFGEDD